MSEALVLTLPLPPSPNVAKRNSRHWWAAYRAREKYFEACDAAQGAGLVPPPPRVAIRRAEATAVLTVWNPNDDDNAFFRAYKFPLDWLRTRGYLANDSRKHIRCSVPEQVVDRKGQSSVRLTITPV